MLQLIKTKDELFKAATEYQEKIEMAFAKDDPEACLWRMAEVEAIMGSSGKLLADAKYWQDEAQSKLKEAIKEVGDVSPSTLNNYVKARTKEENYLVNWLERINRSATHLLEDMRTAISYRKTEMQQLNYQK